MLILWCLLCTAWAAITDYPPSEVRQPSLRHAWPPKGMHGAAVTRSSWFVLVTHSYSEALNATALAPALKADGCVLLRSNSDPRVIIMEIFCESEAQRPLEHTVDYLAALYGIDNMQVERNAHHTTGFWYGNTLSMQSMLNARHGPAPGRKLEIAYARKPHTAFVQQSVTWGLDRIDQRAGLLNSQYDYDTLASDIDVYIVDTGVQTNLTEFGGRALFLYNAVDNVDADCLGHGTHVAGIVGSLTYGVAKGVQLIGVKVLDCTGTGSTYTIIDGLRAVLQRIAQTGRRSVINLSLGGDKSTALDQALLAIATLNNTAVVVAAGNDGDDACNYSPSDLGQAGNILVVAASDYNDARPYWSNTGACVDLSAPGLSILSTWIGPTTSGTNVLSGTSMATPFVTGVAALVLQMQLDTLNNTMDITQVNALITNQATPNVIGAATLAGGGRNLLYSLVDVTASTAPQPQTAPPSLMDTSGGTRARLSPFFVLPFLALYAAYAAHTLH